MVFDLWVWLALVQMNNCFLVLSLVRMCLFVGQILADVLNHPKARQKLIRSYEYVMRVEVHFAVLIIV